MSETTRKTLEQLMRGYAVLLCGLILFVVATYLPLENWPLRVVINGLGAWAIFTAINELAQTKPTFPNAYKIILSVVGLLAVVSLSVAIISFPTSQAVENIAETFFRESGSIGRSFFDTLARWMEAGSEASKYTSPPFWENLADIIRALGDLLIQLRDMNLIDTGVN